MKKETFTEVYCKLVPQYSRDRRDCQGTTLFAVCADRQSRVAKVAVAGLTAGVIRRRAGLVAPTSGLPWANC